MRNRFVVGALTCALLSGGAIAAFAVPASDTTLDFQVKPGSTKAGTTKKPKNTTLQLSIIGGTEDGTGQPATSTALNITLPPTWKLNSDRWPKRARCDIAEVNQEKNTSSCPKGSKIGSGTSVVKGAGGAVTRTLLVTAFVIENGDLGFFIKNKAGESPQVNEMIPGATPRPNKINVKIPDTVQEPIEGVPTGIELLKFKLSATATVKGKTIAIAQTTGCKRGKWKFSVENVYRDGKQSEPDTVNCRA